MKPLFALSCLLLACGICLAQADAQRPKRERPKNRNQQEALKVAELAPKFVLKSLDGESETDLAVLRETKPVVLIFGSYT